MSVGSDSVTVDLLDEAPVSPTSPPPRRRVGLLAAIAAAGIVALVLWPQAGPSVTEADAPAEAVVPPPDDARLLPWPGRGPWVSDEVFISEAGAAWETFATITDAADSPGPVVHTLWAGEVGEVDLAILQSVGEDGIARVAQVAESRIPDSANRGALALSSVATIDGQPEMLALAYAEGLELGTLLEQPGSELVQVLPSPAMLTEGSELQRLDGARFRTVGVQDDGLSRPWVHPSWQAPSEPVVAAVRTQGPEPGLVSVSEIIPGQLIPGAASVELVAPGWGATRPDLPEDYVDALSALGAVGRTSGAAAILGSTPSDRGRVSLVEVQQDGGGDAVVVTVVNRGIQPLVSAPRPTVPPTEVVLGAVGVPGGDVVVVAAGPPDTSLIVLGANGAPIGTGPRTTAVWLPRDDVVTEVAAQGYRDDQTFVGRSTLDVSDL